MAPEVAVVLAAAIGAIGVIVGSLVTAVIQRRTSDATARQLAAQAAREVEARWADEKLRLARDLRRERTDPLRMHLEELVSLLSALHRVNQSWRRLDEEEEAGGIHRHFQAAGRTPTADAIHEFKHRIVRQITGHDKDGVLQGQIFNLITKMRAAVPPASVSATCDSMMEEIAAELEESGATEIDSDQLDQLGHYVRDINHALDSHVLDGK